ncbi:biosynthetic-type acetolactate synthase large subunit [Clostridium sp.]|mgnify:CR=1 FL=1|uniref:biosynthetic-type acetolactate synthase large subunit n=1 Tax=Clostridium sp. TaxID=1506 RepID=UPI002FDC7F3E
MKITGAELFVKALRKEKVNILFGYPGGQVIDLFDVLYAEKDIEVILPRHEQGLVHAADGYARSTGKIGVCLVTSGPGATNIVTGIATANYDSVPLVCFTGQVPISLIGKDAFQEVDIVDITKSITKYSITVRNRDDLGRVIKKAFYIARTGKPGVVVVDLPKDIQCAYGSDEYPDKIEIVSHNYDDNIQVENIKKAMETLKCAQKPVFLIGGGVNIANAKEEMKKLAESTGVPVITTIMGKGAIPTYHPLYIGNIGIHGSYASNTAISQCDVLFSIGTRFNDRITGKVSEFAKNAIIIHVDINPISISRNVKADIPIVADAKEAITMMLDEAVTLDILKWREEINQWKRNYPIHMKCQGMTPEVIIDKINKIFSNAIVVTDVGQNQLWTTQFLELDENKKMLTSGGLGTMGYGFPAALGAKIGNPDKDVIVISGDGGMQMNIQEMATAIVYEIPLIICILNNGYLGNVRQWQEMFFNKRYSSTCLQYRKHCSRECNNPNKGCPKYTPDFVKLAESYGAIGIRVTRTEEIEDAFNTAKKSTTIPTVIEFVIGREENVLPIVPPGNSLSEMIIE